MKTQGKRQAKSVYRILEQTSYKGGECLNCVQQQQQYFPGRVEGSLRLLTGDSNKGKTSYKGGSRSAKI